MKIFTAAFVLTIVSILFFVLSSSADIYKYIDRNGTVCFTNDLRKVPEEYRGQVVVIPEPHDKGKGKQQAESGRGEKEAGKEKGREEGFQWKKVKELRKDLTGGRFFVPVILLIFYVVLFIAVGRISASLEQRKLGLILRIILTLGILIYFWKAH